MTHKAHRRIAALALVLLLSVTGLAGALAAEDSGLIDAENTAIAHAGHARDTITDLRSEFDKGDMEYEISFSADGVLYEYELSAHNGEIEKYSIEHFDAYIASINQKGDRITSDAALQSALEHAGVKEKDTTLRKIEFDTDDGVTFYEVEFYVGATEYEYEINAFDSGVLKCEVTFNARKGA